jgi:ribosomal protein L32
VFREISLYDYAVIGGADKMILMASIADNTSDESLKELTYSHTVCDECGYRSKSLAYTSSYIDWMKKWNKVIDHKIGYVPARINDMYHGKRSDRKYMARRNILLSHQFDPSGDLVIEENGCYGWSEHKQELHEEVKSYFLSRREH